MNVKTLTYSQQQQKAPKTHKKKSTVRVTDRTVFWVPQRSHLYWFLVMDEVKCKTHTQESTSSTEAAETVDLIENAAQHTFKAPSCCFENAQKTLTYCSLNNQYDY